MARLVGHDEGSTASSVHVDAARIATMATAEPTTSPELDPAENLARLLCALSPEPTPRTQQQHLGNGPHTDILAVCEVLNNERVQRDPQFWHKFSGAGFMPWEIHRPQRAVRELAKRGEFRGRVLDVGCGLGDSALFVAKYCCKCQVTACDKVQRCLDFGRLKASIRSMTHAVTWVEADLLEESCIAALEGPFDTVLDSGLLVYLEQEQQPSYLANLQRLVRPGGRLHAIVLAETETRAGPRRFSKDELQVLFPLDAFALLTVEPTVYEQHPSTFQFEAYVATYERLPRGAGSTRVSASGVPGQGL